MRVCHFRVFWVVFDVWQQSLSSLNDLGCALQVFLGYCVKAYLGKLVMYVIFSAKRAQGEEKRTSKLRGSLESQQC